MNMHKIIDLTSKEILKVNFTDFGCENANVKISIKDLSNYWDLLKSYNSRPKRFHPRKNDLFYDVEMKKTNGRLFMLAIPLVVVSVDENHVWIKPKFDCDLLDFKKVRHNGKVRAGIYVYSGEGETENLQKHYMIYRKWFCKKCNGKSCDHITIKNNS